MLWEHGVGDCGSELPRADVVSGGWLAADQEFCVMECPTQQQGGYRGPFCSKAPSPKSCLHFWLSRPSWLCTGLSPETRDLDCRSQGVGTAGYFLLKYFLGFQMFLCVLHHWPQKLQTGGLLAGSGLCRSVVRCANVSLRSVLRISELGVFL